MKFVVCGPVVWSLKPEMRFSTPSFRAALMVVLSAFAVCPAVAQSNGPSMYERQDASQPPANRLPALLMDVGIDQKLGTKLPLELPFTDEQGRTRQAR